MKELLQWLVLSFMLLIMIYQLMVPPIVGIANNGDFERIMMWEGIIYKPDFTFEDKYFNHINLKFDIIGGQNFDPKWKFVSSELLFVKLSVWINHILSKTGEFDLRILGFVHLVFYAVAMYLIISSVDAHRRIFLIGLSLILVFVFLDVGYISYFNSFYSESSILIFLLLSVGLFLKANKTQRIWFLGAFFIVVLLLAWSKQQTGLIGFLVALYGVRMFFLKNDKKTKILIASMSFLLFASTSWYFINGTPAHMKEAQLYDSVFNGILVLSDQPKEELNKLELPADFERFANASMFNAKSPIRDSTFRNIFFNKINHLDVVKYYISNPDKLYLALEVSADHSFNFRPGYGNFEKSSGMPSKSRSQSFDDWSNIKNQFFPKNLWFIFGFLLLYMMMVIYEWRRAKNKLPVEVMMLLPIITGMALVTPFIGVGMTEIGKHMFLFNVLFDICLIIAVFWLLSKLSLSTKLFRRLNFYSAFIRYNPFKRFLF